MRLATLIFGVCVLPFVQLQDAYSQSSFGFRQMEQMIADRPDMAGVLSPVSEVWEFVEKGFESGDFGKRVYWLNESKDKDTAFHLQREEYHPAMIYVSKDELLSKIDRWYLVVFELHNLQNRDEFMSTWEEARSGNLSPTEFANEIVLHEYKALVKTKEFFKRHPIESARRSEDRLYFSATEDLPETEDAFLSYLDDWKSGPKLDVRNFYKARIVRDLAQ